MKSRTTVAQGYLFAEYPTENDDCPIVVQGPHDSADGADNRVGVFTRDESGQWYHTYVESAESGPPIVRTEPVCDRPDSSTDW